MNNTCRKMIHMEVMNRNFTVFCQYLNTIKDLPKFLFTLRIH